MPKCPSCMKEVSEIEKSWKFGQYSVDAYECSCGTRFRTYNAKGKSKFTLARKPGSKYQKVD